MNNKLDLTKPIRCRDGKAFQLKASNCPAPYPIVGIREDEPGKWLPQSYTIEGHHCVDCEGNGVENDRLDLENIPEQLLDWDLPLQLRNGMQYTRCFSPCRGNKVLGVYQKPGMTEWTPVIHEQNGKATFRFRADAKDYDVVNVPADPLVYSERGEPFAWLSRDPKTHQSDDLVWFWFVKPDTYSDSGEFHQSRTGTLSQGERIESELFNHELQKYVRRGSLVPLFKQGNHPGQSPLVRLNNRGHHGGLVLVDPDRAAKVFHASSHHTYHSKPLDLYL